VSDRECNHCHLLRIKAKFGSENVILRHDGHGFKEVRVRDAPDQPYYSYGVWFLAVSEGCCC
jgi:hypothetical protein